MNWRVSDKRYELLTIRENLDSLPVFDGGSVFCSFLRLSILCSVECFFVVFFLFLLFCLSALVFP